MRMPRLSWFPAIGLLLGFGALTAIWLTGPGGGLSLTRFTIGAAAMFGVESVAIAIALHLSKRSST